MAVEKHVFNGTHPEQTAELVRTLLSAHTFGGDISVTLDNPQDGYKPRSAEGVCRDRYLSALGDQTYVHVDVCPQDGIHVLVGGVQLPHEDAQQEHFAHFSLPYSDRALMAQYVEAVYGPVLAAKEQKAKLEQKNAGLSGVVRFLGKAVLKGLNRLPQPRKDDPYFR